MEHCRRLIIAVGLIQFPPSIKDVDGYKYPQGWLICKQAKKETKHCNTKYPFHQTTSILHVFSYVF